VVAAGIDSKSIRISGNDMKRLLLAAFAALAVLVCNPVMADTPSWTILNGHYIGLTGAYPSAVSACEAWYQYYQSEVPAIWGSATYEAPYVAIDPNLPTTTGEVCDTPVTSGGAQFVQATFLERTPSCQSNETFDPDADECVASDTDAGKNAGDAGDCNGGVGSVVDNKVSCDGTTMVTDPINTATGNKFQQDTDFGSSLWLTFRRFYNSVTVLPSTLGPQWRH